MIRPPPSSISLAESDVQFHLQLLNIRHSLLRQGFKQQDIMRYLDDYVRKDTSVDTCPAPTAVDLAVAYPRKLRKTSSSSHVSLPSSDSLYPDIDIETTAVDDTGKDVNEAHDVDDGSEEDSPELPSPRLVTRHAPRQSSLLRFSTAASTSSPSSDGDDNIPLPSPLLTRSESRRWLRSRMHRREDSLNNDLAIQEGVAQLSLDTGEGTPRHHYVDGNAFSVYNDAQPAAMQPATPADLSRRPLITEHDAAYTVPPGTLRAGDVFLAASPASARFERQIDPGEESPTVRAISLRERRYRELVRGSRAEALRLQRMRRRDEGLFAGGGGMTPAGEGLGLEDVWRDVLEADRVGEENFEAEASVDGDRIMRVVSGNARFEETDPRTER